MKIYDLLFLKRLLGSDGKTIGRFRFHDDAIQFRMRAGFAGDVNRTHPFTVEPCLIDAAAPPTLYGQAVVIDPTTQGVRPIVAGDSALTDVYGFTVRPFPLQMSSSSQGFGGTQATAGTLANSGNTPPTSGVIDVLRSGYIMTQLSGSVAAVKGGAVDVWFAVNSGSHVQGNVEAVHTGGSSFALPSKSTFNGPADANGIVELIFNV